MSESLELLIDLNDAGLDLDPEDLEAYAQRFVTDLKAGLVKDAALVRGNEVPDGSKAGEAGFDLGKIKAIINPEKLKPVLGWIQNQLKGTLEIQYGDVKLKYRTSEELEQQVKALETISKLTVRVFKGEAKQN